MVDVFNSEKRSKIMASVKSENTKPELIVRKLLHSMGYRFRLHRKDLPGTPDIVLPKYKKVIFIHGCFWHGHDSCPRARLPKTNREFWEKKIKKNKIRDEINIQKLVSLGWDPVIVWTCEIKNINELKFKLKSILGE